MIVFKGGGRSKGGLRTGLGTSFAGLAAYLAKGPRDALNPDRVAWVSYRNLQRVDDPAGAAQVMRAHAGHHPRTGKPVYHFGLSLYPGEHLNPEQWDQAVDRVLQRMGLARHQTLVIAHRDTEKDHVHVVVNRVGPDGHAWSPRRDMVKAREAVRRIETDHGLIRTGARDLPVPELTSGAYHQALRTGQQPLADRVRDQAAADFAAATGWRELEERLAARGFRLEPAARGSGLLVGDGSRSASLSRVDRALSGPQLARRFGESFREHRDAHPEPPTVLPSGRAHSALPGASLEQRAAALLERVTDTQATFTEAHLHRAAFHQPEGRALVREALRSEQVLDLGRDSRGHSRYTTREYLEAEARLLVAAASLSSREQFRLDAEVIAHALAAGEHAAPALSAEQRAAVLHATTEADLAQVVGRAGAGKTTAARAIAAAYQESGYEVRGAALAGKAAEVLQTETGVPSRTLASLEHAWSEGADRLHPRAVLLVDEAGMVEVRRLGRILAEAEARGAKVVLLGDPDQLKAIGAGDAFRGLLEQHPSARIDAIRRQQEPWQRAASEQLAGGRVASALDTYEDAGRLHWTDTRAAAQADLLASYTHDRRQDPGGAQLILAYRNAEVAQLNDAVRAERRTAGELGPGVSVGSIELARGDRIVFLRNDNQGRDVVNVDAAAALGVRNGTLGTVVGAESNRLAVRLDDGRTVAFDPARYSAVAHGYAVTVHKSQGATMDRVYVLADPLMNRNAAYVALTRHRTAVDLFADRETFPGREHLDRALSRIGHKDLASDYASADLRRAVTRLQELAAKTTRAALEERPLREALAAHLALRDARQRVVEARRSLARPASQLYVDPAKALRSLLRDSAAPDRLRQGEARQYGELRGRSGSLLRGRSRAGAFQATASLTGRLDAYQRSIAGLHAAKQAFRAQLPSLPRLDPDLAAKATSRGLPSAAAARAPMPRPAQIRRELARVTVALRAYQRASRGAQDAIEIAVRGMGRTAVNSALLLLPPKVAIPVGLAVRAVAMVVDRGLDVGLGR